MFLRLPLKGLKLAAYFKTINEIFSNKKMVYFFLGLYAFRYILAATIPLGSDEAYYWDWGRDLQLSYYDHPPFVAWISSLGQLILSGKSFLQARLLVPFMHFLSSLNLIFIARLLNGKILSKNQLYMLILATQLAPIMNLGSFMLVPDVGLFFCLSIFFSICSYYLVNQDKQLSIISSASIGLSAGLAVASKYHAIAMLASSALYLLFSSRKFRSLSFMINFLVSFLFAASPVIIWNFQHDLISFGFQLQHGFAKPSFHLIWGLRIIVAQFLLCTPFVIVILAQVLSAHYHKAIVGLLLSGCVPLLLLFLGVAFYKEALPHWPLPCIIMLSPLIVLAKQQVESIWFKLNLSYSLLVAIVLSTCLGIEELRHQLPKFLNHKPGGLGEITLWDQLMPELEKYQIWDSANGRGLAIDCRDNTIIGSFRWFWVAQLAFHAPTDTKLYSFDQNHLSYYNFRDSRLKLRGCPVILIGEVAHINLDRLADVVDITREEHILLADHRDRPIKIIWGYLTKENTKLTEILSLSASRY